MVGAMRLNFVYWVRGEDYAELATKSAASVRRCYPDARVFVYADQAHNVLRDSIIDAVLVIPAFNASPAMVANLQAQAHFCLGKEFIAPTVFLDADILAIQAAPELEDPEFWLNYDLVVTQRDHVAIDTDGNKVIGLARDMPYNYGVVMVNNDAGGQEAILQLRERVRRMGTRLQQWYGNQWALRELVGGGIDDETPRTITRDIHFWRVRVRVLDCEQFNFTPETDAEDLSGRYFLHPKGDRKDLFHHYAEELA